MTFSQALFMFLTPPTMLLLYAPNQSIPSIHTPTTTTHTHDAHHKAKNEFEVENTNLKIGLKLSPYALLGPPTFPNTIWTKDLLQCY